MKAIILAAGVGKRLKAPANTSPKCLLEIGGKSILMRQIEALHAYGIKDISVVVGYKAEEVKNEAKGLAKFYLNKDFESTGLLESIHCAKKELNNELILLYGDVAFQKRLIGKILETKHDFAMVADRQTSFRPAAEKEFETYHGKKIPKGHTIAIIQNGLVKKIGKDLQGGKESAEYIGISAFSKAGAETLKKEIETLIATGKISEYPSPSFLFQKLIKNGKEIHPIFTDGIKYAEIDYPEDLENARKESKLFD